MEKLTSLKSGDFWKAGGIGPVEGGGTELLMLSGVRKLEVV
jgi:hypothetical protein